MEQKAKSCYRCGREGHIVRCVLCSRLRFRFCNVLFSRCYSGIYLSRVIAPNLRVLAALEEGQVVVVLAQNAIAVARSVTLRVRAPRRPEVVQEAEAATAGEAEATVVLGAGAVGAVKKLGGRRVLPCRLRGTNISEVTLAVE